MAKYSNGLEDELDIPYSSVTVLEKRYLAKGTDNSTYDLFNFNKRNGRLN